LIGLGLAKSIRSVEITWPAGNRVQALKDLAMDQFYRIREGEAKAVRWELKKFQLAKSANAHAMHHHQ